MYANDLQIRELEISLNELQILEILLQISEIELPRGHVTSHKSESMKNRRGTRGPPVAQI